MSKNSINLLKYLTIYDHEVRMCCGGILGVLFLPMTAHFFSNDITNEECYGIYIIEPFNVSPVIVKVRMNGSRMVQKHKQFSQNIFKGHV